MNIRKLPPPPRPKPKAGTAEATATRSGLLCPYCGAGTKVIDSALVYAGQGYGWLVACARWPACDAYVGCHRGTTDPKGRLADRALREAKTKAHAVFDPLWLHPKRDRKNRRDKAYAWLAQQLGIKPAYCHIGMMDVKDCLRVVDLCRKYRPRDAATEGA